MNAYEPIGYLASLLVLATFSVRGMVPLRLLAITSNLAFIGYAALARIDPVLLLHALLLPVNVYRLLQELRERPGRSGRSVDDIA
jgi:CRP/FNR family transcriptional regulator, cyclic AMP receptor protein